MCLTIFYKYFWHLGAILLKLCDSHYFRYVLDHEYLGDMSSE